MDLATTFLVLLQPLAEVMTRPSFDKAVTIISGWVFAPRRTVTGMIVAAGATQTKHFSAYHRLFSRAVWSRDQLGLAVFELILRTLARSDNADDKPILLAIDDTLARKRGKKIFGVGMHHDPLVSSRNTTITAWGRRWVIAGSCWV